MANRQKLCIGQKVNFRSSEPFYRDAYGIVKMIHDNDEYHIALVKPGWTGRPSPDRGGVDNESRLVMTRGELRVRGRRLKC